MYYLTAQHTDTSFEIALFTGNKHIDTVTENKQATSRLFIPLLDNLLRKNKVSLTELSFFAINAGPGPFSTLRSIIASVNGIGYATGIPLIGIDGLQATFVEFYDTYFKNTVILLNAFNNESYYLIAEDKHVIKTGYKKTTILMEEIAQQFADQDTALIDNKICSIATIASLAYEQYLSGRISSDYLRPLHLKKHPVEL
jgi:tRNA A37 threonylcarbamoyladenosine modification protein TsaB